MGRLIPPEPLSPAHCVGNFDCGITSLNLWIRHQALKNEASGASRAFVVCQENEVVAYYALATGSIIRQKAPAKIRRAMPDPIPVMILGRLAVALNTQGSGLGGGLLKDAILRTYNVSLQVGVRALLAHALSEDAKAFYLRHGFIESPIEPMTLMLNLQEVQNTLEKNIHG